MASVGHFLPGQRVLVCYDLDPAEELWHERLLLAKVGSAGEWIIATPELDLYLWRIWSMVLSGCLNSGRTVA